MDSVTHLFFGGAIAAAVAPARHHRAAMLAGMALNTLPDLDVFALDLLDDPVLRMTWHRSATHSWLVLPWVAWGLWAFFRRRGGRVAQAPRRWFWVIMLTVLSHPLLDAFTVYGTQLLWPLPMRPLMWSSLFIIDPLFALPWFIACVVAWFARESVGRVALRVGIAVGVAYVGWSLWAKTLVEAQADRALAQMGLRDAPRFSVPMPLNTLLWRVVAMTPGGYVEGFRSLIADHGPMHFTRYASDVNALNDAADLPTVAQLTWFNHGFMGARVVQGQLQLRDLRMGNEPDYFFSFAVASRSSPAAPWQALLPQSIPQRGDRRQNLIDTWQRLWHQPSISDDTHRAALTAH